MVKKVVMPSAGQTTDVATVTKLHVAVGDAVRKGDVLMEVETDKAVLPIESFAKGFVTEICVNEFDKVDAGTLLLTIGDAADLEAAKSCAKTNTGRPSTVPLPATTPASCASMLCSTKLPPSSSNAMRSRAACLPLLLLLNASGTLFENSLLAREHLAEILKGAHSTIASVIV